jgi:hypothetical protein
MATPIDGWRSYRRKAWVTANDKPPFDAIGRDYARLAFGIQRHVPGFIDAYLGPEDERAALDADPSPQPTELAGLARDLLTAIAAMDAGDNRKGYLTKQVEAMQATVRRLIGDAIPYRDEVRLLFDVEAQATPETVYDAAIADLERLLPGDGSVADRMFAWKQGYAIAPEVARRVVDEILPDLRERTQEFVDLPTGEAIEIRLVEDQPWSGYNWYLGGGRSRVDLNTDLPIYAYRLTDLMAHEAYPGHHTEHALKERLYTSGGLSEHALQLINTPECVISEGIATMAEGMLFSPAELVRFRRERVYPAAGIAGDPEREMAIGEALRVLRSVAGNAALLLHDENRDPDEVVAYLRRYGLSSEGEARQRLRFIADPLWRAYIFTYHVGYDLITGWLTGLSHTERRARYHRLLTEQVYPSQIAAWTRQEAAATPV